MEAPSTARTSAAPEPSGGGAAWGVVVIGRNEGERLLRALDALPRPLPPAVYVDSGSSDGSPAAVEARGVPSLALDPARPFSAARARNEGLAWLRARHPELAFVQFLDGDCELRPGWIEAALATLRARPRVAVLAGLLVEHSPDATPYAHHLALEWELPPLGSVESVGGIFVGRVAALDAVGGFSAELIAGEEYDLGKRLGRAGWRIARIDAPMAVHDAGVSSFRQWWKRCLRSGHTHVQSWMRFGRDSGHDGLRAFCSSQWWGLGLYALALGLAWPTRGWSLLLLALVPVQLWRMARYVRGLGFPAASARLFAVLCLLGMTPQALGQWRGLWLALRRRRSALIEYK